MRNQTRIITCLVALLAITGTTRVWAQGIYTSWGATPNPVIDGSVAVTIGGDGPSTGTPITFTVYANGKYLCSYTDSNSTPIWSCTGTIASAGTYTLTATSSPSGIYRNPSPLTVVVAAQAYFHPKYQVMTVFYAPPGAKTGARSQVSYGTSYQNGTTTNTSNSFSTTDSVTVSGKITVPIGTTGVTLSITGSVDDSVTQTIGNSQSNTVTSTASSTYTLSGDAVDGIDHSNDLIRVWLNPIYRAAITSSEVYNQGVVADGADPVTKDSDQLDTVDLPVSVLKQLVAGASASALGYPVLNRTWAASEWTAGSPALTPEDYQDILNADPFIAHPTLSPVNNPRFDVAQDAPLILYYPAATPQSESFTLSTQTTSTQGQSASDSHSTTVSVDGQLGTVGNNVDLKVADQWTTTNMWSSSNTTSTTQSAGLVVQYPLTSDGYTGPHDIAVYVDNVYGTFVFYPIPGT
jgi:hypothetical protein